jgi:hypothetical protein
MCATSDKRKSEYCSRCSKTCSSRLWDISECSNYEVCTSEKCALQRSGLSSQQMKKKPHIFDKHVKARLDFARVHEYYTLDDQGRVIFSKELKINRFCSDGLS